MKNKIYDAVYRLFEEGDYSLTITVGGIEMRLYNPEDDNLTENIWYRGVIANGTVYQIGDLYMEGKGPGTYAKLLRGDYNIIRGLAECIYDDNYKSLSKE